MTTARWDGGGPARASRRIGRYEVVRELGRGGMGVVYEVRDPTSGQRFALKLILIEADAEALARFGREAELMARVSHPNVVRVRALERAPEGPYIVTDLVEGQPLSRAARAAPMAPETAAPGERAGRRSRRSTPAACCIATSSRRTSWSAPTARPCSSTSAWRATAPPARS